MSGFLGCYTHFMTKVSAYFGVSRGPFLILPVTLVICGAGASAYHHSFSWPHTALALVGLVALHMAVNIFNEVSDFKTGIDLETEATPFSGGSGTLPSGSMTPRTATIFGVICSIIGGAVGVFFLVKIGWPMVPLVIAGAFLVLTYTNLMARIGLGEVAAGLGLGALPVLGTALVQTGRIGSAVVVAAIPAFLMTLNLLLLNEFPDEKADRHGGRRNLVLMFGRIWAARIYLAAALAVPLVLAIGVWMNILPATALIAAAPTLLLIGAISWAWRSPETDPPIPALGANVIWNLATNTILGVVLLIAAIGG
ncbi:MAG: prenyltransferase [Acidobacteria bacterium]|nr:MAG: prenyltransferase [Acidobacteriota bacterium]